MKKKLFSTILVVMLALSMALSVSAAPKTFVLDDAGLLTQQEAAELSGTLSRLSDTYDAQIVVVTIPSAEGNDPDSIVEYFYDNMGIGYGENLDGVLLLVCMDPREYRILSNGYCAAAINTGAIDDIGNAIVNDLSGGDYAEAFEGFSRPAVGADGTAVHAGGGRSLGVHPPAFRAGALLMGSLLHRCTSFALIS